MDLLKQTRLKLIDLLWQSYKKNTRQAEAINYSLTQIHHCPITLDHLAIIDLPGPATGINPLCQIFSTLGFTVQGRDYLPEKQNEFLWMAETDAFDKPVANVLPQVVLADFRLDEMPINIRKIIYKYATQAKLSPVAEVQKLCGNILLGKDNAQKQLIKLLASYFLERDWPLPEVKEFQEIQEFNELLAWTLVFGRIPNHFTISVHLLQHKFPTLHSFNEFVINTLKIPLNSSGGIIKGCVKTGIEQSSTLGSPSQVQLANGAITIPNRFIEFVWRYPINNKDKPIYWNDYYTGFMPQNANHVIESLYATEEPRTI